MSKKEKENVVSLVSLSCDHNSNIYIKEAGVADFVVKKEIRTIWSIDLILRSALCTRFILIATNKIKCPIVSLSTTTTKRFFNTLYLKLINISNVVLQVLLNYYYYIWF